jgi:prefoldin subunit 5
MSDPNYASTLTALRERQGSHPLTILNLAEPIIAAAAHSSPSTRKSNGSDSANSDVTDPTPTTLLSDLTHYKELFSKLRFSYLEQVTKEKYLRSIVGDPPLLVSHAENVALEEKLSVVKADLKTKKEDVGRLVEEIEAMARVLASRWEGVQGRMALLEDLPPKVQGLEETVRELREKVAEQEGAEPRSEDPRMNVGLEETERLVTEQRERMRELDRQIAAVQRALPAKMRECEVVEGELEALERRKNDVTTAATEARRVREEGGRDELEEKGRWYRSAEVVLRSIVGVDA